MRTTQEVQPHRMSHVDAIRAVAVLLVMWTHYAEEFSAIAGSQQWLNGLQQYGGFGRIGVVVFFALSGLLIPKGLTGSTVDGTRRFLIRRFFRLYPAFWLSIPLGYLAYWTLFNRKLDVAGWLANATMIPVVLGQPEVMGHYWTLETELAFYLLCLALFWLGGVQHMRALCMTCIGLCVAFVITSAFKIVPATALGQYKGMLYHLSIMFWGACFRKAYDAPNERMTFNLPGALALRIEWSYKTWLLAMTALIAGTAMLTGAVAFVHNDSQHMINSISYVLGLALFALLATVWKIHLRLFAWLGEISYSIYLLHGIPLYCLYWVCERAGWVGAPLGVYMIATTVLAVGLSWLSFRAVEAPCIRFAHALTSSRRAKVPNAVYNSGPAADDTGR
ncbi:acyltransferase [Caballeronia calidae]|uniref:Acyltransferase n=2 Tax=Caballeronia calidae TaxID=1777139 RepID=A0A158CPU5_9BURK|nr:acyltransferase [Caballeronia calidae]